MSTIGQHDPLAVVRDAMEAAGHRTRPDRDGFRVRCPAHAGRSDGSLAVSAGADGRPLIYCHGGCTTAAVLDAVGLSWAALSPPLDELGQMLERSPAPRRDQIDVDEDELRTWLGDARIRLLEGRDGAAARAYLRSRGVTGDDVRTYRLGLAPAARARGPLGRLRSRIVLAELPWRLEGRVVPGCEAQTYRPERRYQTEGPKRAWGAGDVLAGHPVVIVEGPLDRIAVGRIAGPDQVVALCGSSGVRADDVARMVRRGVDEALVLLDGDVSAEKLARVMADLALHGIRPIATTGLTSGDPADLLPGLTAGDDAAWRALSEALTVPEGVSA